MSFITCLKKNDAASLRVFCFPYAGGTAQVFMPWVSCLPDSIELMAIQYPGRGARFSSRPIDSCVAIAKYVASEIKRYSDKPFVLLGYSMGGAIAFEVMRYLSLPPERIYLCASCPPSSGKRYLLCDDDLLESIQRIGGVDERLFEDEEMRAIILRMMRNDFKILDTYRPMINPAAAPMHVWAGEDDPHVPVSKAMRWQEYCNIPVHKTLVQGGHFFIQSAGEQLLQELDVVASSLCAEAGYSL